MEEKKKGWGNWWRVYTVQWNEDKSATITPVSDPKAARQWAHAELLRLQREKDGNEYVIVETDTLPGWNYGTYGLEPGNEEMEKEMQARGWG